MANIILFHFEQYDIRYVGDGINHEWVAQDVCDALGIGNTSQSLSKLDNDEKGIILNETLGGGQKMLTVNEPGLYALILGSRKPIAKKFKRWVFHEVLPSIRKTGSYSLEQDKEKLERQFSKQKEITPKDRLDVLKILKIGGHSKEYIQRVAIQQAKAIDPSLLPPAPEEMLSLPVSQALLTPTEIATQIGVFCKSNPESGDPRWVNKKLEELGYQEKIAGKWSATEKAISAQLCDRKPVETGSRTQKDQLMWSSRVIDILSEHKPA